MAPPSALAAGQSAGNFAASAIAGILWTTISPGLAFGWLAAWMAVALVAFLATAGRFARTTGGS